MTELTDALIRSAAFDWLAQQMAEHGDSLPRLVLQKGFKYRGQRVPLVGPQGIFKPRVMSLPLSITTALDGPYDDRVGQDDFIYYRYRGTDPQHPDNIRLRLAGELGAPLVYFVGLGRGRYEPIWPVLIVGDDPASLTFTVAADDLGSALALRPVSVADDGMERRRYITVAAKRRLHQQAFREQVLTAYSDRCAVCRLGHRELLDGAHILEDYDGGPPTVANGLALCKLHHAAFDRHVMGIHPEELTVAVRQDVLDEIDGPMLVHGLQALHRARIQVPRRTVEQPDRQFLATRYRRFLAA